jgi:hypothetical protein
LGICGSGCASSRRVKVFHCDHCGHLLFFENIECVSCHHRLAFLPDLRLVGSLDPDADGLWRSPLQRAAGRAYRLCSNYTDNHVCNWAVRSDDASPLCTSCRLTRVIPDLTNPEYRTAWYRVEAAKRRLVFTLMGLGLPVRNRDEDPERGLAFEFKADPPEPGAPRVFTGHAAGVITINIAEADDAERERRRVSMHEPYRTLLGHVRHEIGHYYWERLVVDGAELEQFRAVFGDERREYGDALRRHYACGPPPDWQVRFVSAYAAAHPWEDWAETFAHYLHMVDTLETAEACGLSLSPRRGDEPSLQRISSGDANAAVTFEHLLESWFPVTYAINNLNRSLGVPDGYPFVLADLAIGKLRYVHDVVERARVA